MMTTLKRLIAPPVFDNERDTRTAYLLNTISISYFLIISSLTLLGLLQDSTAELISIVYANLANRVLPIVIAVVVAQVVMRRGNIKLASYLYVTFLWLSLAWGTWFSGGIQSTSLSAFILVVLIAGLLIGSRGAIFVAGLTALYAIVLIIFQSQGFMQSPPIEDVERLLAFMLNLSLSAIYLTLYIRSLDEALVRVETSNELLEQIRENLEVRVSERTKDLALAAEIGQNISQIQNLSQLATTAVSLIQQRFDLYHAQLYLADAEQSKLTLFSGTGDAGKQMMAAGHSLPINTASLNGRAAVDKQAVIVSDTATRDDFKPHPLLPNTRSETAVPLIVGDNVVGVLDLQSNQPNTFTEENLPAFVTLAGQLAIAVQNSRLFTEQKRIEERLTEEQERTLSILESISTPVVIARVSDGVIVYVNEPSAQITGVPRDELEGRPTPDFFYNPEERQVYINKLRQEGFVRNYEVVLKKNDGTPYWALLTGKIVQFQDETVTFTSFIDITERKEIETELTKFMLGMERSSDAVFLTEPDGRISYVNEAFENIYGYSKEEAIGQTPRIIKSGLVSQEQYEYFWETLLSGGIIAGEIVNKTKDGRLIHIEGNNNPILDESGGVIGFLAMHRDITERKQSEEAAREQETLLRTIIDSTPDWIFIKDTEHRYQLVNQAYADSMHLSVDEFLGKNDIEIGFPEDIVKGNPKKGIRGFWQDDQEIMEIGETKVIDEEPAVVDGEPRILNTIKVPLKDNEGRVSGIVGFVHDITNIKEAESIVAKQAEELQTVADLSTAVSTTRDTKQLLQEVVNRTKESFNLYHAHIYLLNESDATLMLTAGAGDVGIEMVSQGHHIRLDNEKSLVAQAARTRQGVIVNDVLSDPAFLPNQLLPDTRSEMAVPMMVGNRVIGVLDVQSEKMDAFSETDINIQTTLATQIAVALENAHAYEQANELATVIENTTNIIVTASLDQKIQYMNHAGLTSIGYQTQEEILGKPIGLLFPAEGAEEQRAMVISAVQEKGLWQGESYLVKASGDTFPVEQTVTLLTTDDGLPKMLIFNMIDITDRREAEAAQQALNAELEAQLERINALQRAMTREAWQAFMTTTADKRPYQGFEFNQEGIKTLTAQELPNGKNGKSSAENQSELINPVTIQGTTIGRIGVRNPSGKPLTDEQRELLASLTGQVAEALDRARLFEETELGRQEIEQQAADLTTVNEISDLASTLLNLDDLFMAVGDRLQETFDADSVYIAMFDAQEEMISYPYFHNQNASVSKIPSRSIHEGGGLTAQVIKTRQPLLYNSIQEKTKDENYLEQGGQLLGDDTAKSFLAVPMILGDTVIGVIGISSNKETQKYDESDQSLLTILASTVGVAIQNAQQFEETQRRANREALVNEISQKIQNAPTVERAMQTAVAELGKALGIQRAMVKLNTNRDS